MSEKINDIINRNNELSRKIKDILGEINQELETNKENAAVIFVPTTTFNNKVIFVRTNLKPG